MAAVEGETYFYCAACPCAESCSAAAWKRAAVWGWTLEEAKNVLMRHLTLSGNHMLDEDMAGHMVEVADDVEEPYVAPPPENPRKRQRSEPAAAAAASASLMAEIARQIANSSGRKGS